MNRLFAAPVLALGLGFAAMPASAVVYCKTVGVPKGCVARPAAAVAAPGVGVPPAAVVAPGASATNQNGGVNRVGVRR
jgi:hypothetical protein